MIRRLNQYLFLLRLSTYFLPFISSAAAWTIRFGVGAGTSGGDYDPYHYFSFILFVTVVWAIVVEHYKLAGLEELFLENTGIRGTLKAVAATYFVILAVLYLMRSESFSRIFLVVSSLILLIATLWLRAIFRMIVRRKSEVRKPIRVLMIGADQFARRAARRLQNGPFACRIIGFVRVPGQTVRVSGLPVYDLERIGELELNHGIDDLVIALSPEQFSRIPQIMRSVERLCLPVRAILDLGEGTLIREKLFQFGRLQMLDLISTPADNPDYSLLKRAFDVVFSLMVVIVAAPLMLLIAILIKLTSPGPVLFKQDRVGLSGKVFKMYKFRTMRVAPAAESDTMWTTENDPRRTRFGSFLRRTSLDELPQFFNVLKGDMSVVGPRPERPHFVRKFLSDFSQYHSRHRLKAGITGWAQVNGLRGDTSIQKRVEYDLYYLQNWSLGFDIRIIFMTIVGGLASKNAY